MNNLPKLSKHQFLFSQWKTIFVRYNSGVIYSTEQLKAYQRELTTMKTYDPLTQSIQPSEIGYFLKHIGYPRTPEQIKKYEEFFNKMSGGKYSMDEMTRYMATQHDPKLILSEYAVSFDKDKDGFISKEEYEYGIETLEVHDPAMAGKGRKISYEKFVQEADTNKSGKVSVQELTDWLIKLKF